MTPPQPYTHSSGIGSGWLLPLVGVGSATLCAVPWAFANVQESLAGFLSIVLVALLAAGCAWPVAFGARVLRCRNVAFLRLVACGTSLFGIYASWSFFAIGLAQRTLGSVFAMAADPVAMWKFLVHTNAEGWYSIFEVRPTGVILGSLWVLEAALVFGAAWWMAPRFLRCRAYCDRCHAWCKPGRDLLIPVLAGRTMKGIRARGLASLQEVVIPDGESNRSLQIYVWQCPSCEFAVFGANQLHQTKGRRSVDAAISEPVLPPSIRRPEDIADIERIQASLKEARSQQFAGVETNRPIEPRVDS